MGRDQCEFPLLTDGFVPRFVWERAGRWGAARNLFIAASIFHFGEYTVGDVKKFLAERTVPVRLVK